MGWAERCNPDSEWNKKRVLNMSSKISSPILSSEKVTKVSIPAKQDEPTVIQVTPKSLFWLFKEFLWRILNLKSTRSPQSHAPTS